MIGLFVKIPYHAQIRRAQPELAKKLREAVSGAAVRYGARLSPWGGAFLLDFDEDEGCARLRAAEASRELGAVFAALSDRLHGWALILEAIEGLLEDLGAKLEQLWFRVEGDGLFLGPGALPLFAEYLDILPGPIASVRGFPYAQASLPGDYELPRADPSVLERFVDEIGRHAIGESGADILVASGPAAVKMVESALGALYGEMPPLLRFRAGVMPAPYGPILHGLSQPRAAALELLSGPERTAFQDLTAVAKFITASPYRRRYSDATRTRFQLFAASRFELYARERRAAGQAALVLFEGLDAFPPESLELLRGLLNAQRTEAQNGWGLVLLATVSDRTRKFGELRLRSISAPSPVPSAMAEAATRGAAALGAPALAPNLAYLARSDLFRLGLGLRLASRHLLPSDSALPTEELALKVLGTFPEEFAEFLRALSLAEEVLEGESLDEFLSAAGFVSGLRPLLYRELERLGYLASEGNIARAEVFLPDPPKAGTSGSRLEDIFVDYLFSLHEKKRLVPSLALYRRFFSCVAGRNGDGRWERGDRRGLFLLDCLAAEALYGPSETESVEGTDETLLLLGPYFAAYGRGEGEVCARSLEALEKRVLAGGVTSLEMTACSLVRASDDYARGLVPRAATTVRPALIAFHGLGAARAEARAHRLLGLCSLAQAQIQEGADYLSNADELAELIPDPLEAFFSSFAGAAAFLILGDLKRAAQRCEAALGHASSSFRADWELACDFLAGRIAFELGRYAEAEEDFGRVRSGARIYSCPEPARRAEVWSGRAAAWSGAPGRARELLGRWPEDAEAHWFLAELEAIEESWAAAASLADSALALLPRRSFFPTDALLWDSGFDNIEGRALGFGGERSYLEDQVTAFAAFARGMAEGDPQSLAPIAERARDRRLAPVHPQAHVYDFYCYRICERLGSAPLDGMTFLSRAWKGLQNRTARMEDAGLKDQYLEANRWNREILRAAKAAKLL